MLANTSKVMVQLHPAATNIPRKENSRHVDVVPTPKGEYKRKVATEVAHHPPSVERILGNLQFMITNIITATLSAYCACKTCCGPNAKGITANGQRPKEGITIAASRSIKYGSLISYDGRIYQVQDRLARRYDSRFDIYFAKHSDAKKFGIKTNQTVTITTK